MQPANFSILMIQQRYVNALMLLGGFIGDTFIGFSHPGFKSDKVESSAKRFAKDHVSSGAEASCARQSMHSSGDGERSLRI